MVHENDPDTPKPARETYVEPVEKRPSPVPLIIGIILALAVAYFVVQRFTGSEPAVIDTPPAAEVVEEPAATPPNAVEDAVGLPDETPAEVPAETPAEEATDAAEDAAAAASDAADAAASAAEEAADAVADEADALGDAAATAAEDAADAAEGAATEAEEAAQDALDDSGDTTPPPSN